MSPRARAGLAALLLSGALTGCGSPTAADALADRVADATTAANTGDAATLRSAVQALTDTAEQQRDDGRLPSDRAEQVLTLAAALRRGADDLDPAVQARRTAAAAAARASQQAAAVRASQQAASRASQRAAAVRASQQAASRAAAEQAARERDDKGKGKADDGKDEARARARATRTDRPCCQAGSGSPKRRATKVSSARTWRTRSSTTSEPWPASKR